MSIPYQAELNSKRPDQIKLFVHCVSDVQAEALWRALRRQFAWVSHPLSSFNPSFSHFFFVTTSEEALNAAWPHITAASAAAIATVVTPTPLPRRPATQLSDLATWKQRFREAVRRVHEEIPHQSEATQEISLGWVVEQVRVGNADAVEALLNQPLLSVASALRAQIALFSETDQHERLIALVEARRREVLALPVSGLLAEQIVGAYLEFGRSHEVADALRSAQRIAQALLPELERLGQAAHVRELLRQGLAPIAPPLEATPSTLREQLAGLVQVAPVEQIAALEELRHTNAGAIEVQLALGSAYAAEGQLDAALAAYTSATPQSDSEQAEVISQRVELLIEAERYQEAVEQLPYADDMSSHLVALRGAALYWLGRLSEAREALEQAWDAGERRRALLLPLARMWATTGQDDRALSPYRLLQDNAPDLLEPEDLARLALGLYLDRPEDVSGAQIAALCDTYVQRGGPAIRPAQEVGDMLRLRAELWAHADRDRWSAALVDRLEWLAAQGRVEELQSELDTLRAGTQQGWLERREHFEMLEGLELAALGNATIRAKLTGEYQSICTAIVDAALLRNEPIPTFVQAIQRSLHFLDRVAADFIAEYITDERDQLIRRSFIATEQVFAAEPRISLSTLRLTIVGGHSATRREIERELRENHDLADYLEVAPSSEEHVDRSKVRDCVVGRDLVAVIAGYTGHDLTNHVRDLQRTGDITGRVIWTRCRGKSGVMREILEALQSG